MRGLVVLRQQRLAALFLQNEAELRLLSVDKYLEQVCELPMVQHETALPLALQQIDVALVDQQLPVDVAHETFPDPRDARGMFVVETFDAVGSCGFDEMAFAEEGRDVELLFALYTVGFDLLFVEVDFVQIEFEWLAVEVCEFDGFLLIEIDVGGQIWL